MATAVTPPKGPAAEDRITALIERLTVPRVSNNRRSVMIAGMPGKGKTEAVLQAPGPIGCVYTDRNRDTLLKMMALRGDITEIGIDSWSRDWKPFQSALDNRELPFESIVIDSLDELYGIGAEHIKAKAGGTMEFDQWEELRVLGKNLTFSLTQATRPYKDRRAYNVLCTMHLQAMTGKKEELLRYAPAMQGSFRDKIEQYFDFVLLADSETKMVDLPGGKKEKRKQYFLRTVEPSPFYTCKARSGWPSRVEDFNEVQALINQELAKE